MLQLSIGSLWMMSAKSMLRYLEINLAILRCFVSGMMSLQKLPHALWTCSEDRSIHVPMKPCKDYEEKMQSLAEHIRQRTPPESRIISTHSLLVAHRVLWIAVAATSDNLMLFLLVGSLQFVVALYSLAAALMMYVMHTFTHVLGHFASAVVIHFLPSGPRLDLEINNTFILVFLGVGFLATAYYAMVSNSDGLPKQFPTMKNLHHMIYGTFNGKGFLVLLLLMCKGRSVSLSWILVDALLGISPVVNNCMQNSIFSWESLFYHIHRMEHLPVVYEHAHRCHHHLTDGSAWDAHVFSGAGFPEDFFFLLQDIITLRSGLPVPCMTYRLLKHQLANKDAHQRREAPYEHEEYHQDHHLHHRANYGFNRPMLDLVFGTYKRTNKEWIDVNDARYKKETTSDGDIVIHMKVDKVPFPELSKQNPAGWQMRLWRFIG